MWIVQLGSPPPRQPASLPQASDRTMVYAKKDRVACHSRKFAGAEEDTMQVKPLQRSKATVGRISRNLGSFAARPEYKNMRELHDSLVATYTGGLNDER